MTKQRSIQHVVQTLAGEIESGVLPVGAALPTQAALARRFDVSRYVIRAAFVLLAERQLITSWQGAGAVVRGREWPYPITTRTRIHESLKSFGADTTITLADTRPRVRPEAEVAEFLGLSLRERVPFAEFIIDVDGVPVAIGHHFIHPHRFDDVLKVLRQTGEIIGTYAALGIPDYMRRKTIVRTRLPKEREAALLGIPRQQPLFVLRGLNVDPDGNALEVTEAIVRGDRIHLAI